MISDVYFPRINGVSTSIQTFKSEFERAGHEVILIAPQYNSLETQEESVIRIKSRTIPFDPEDRMMSSSCIRKMIPALKKSRFDVIHIQTPFVAHYCGVKIARSLNIPCVITYHTLFEEYLYHYIPLVPKQALRFFARRFSTSQCNQAQGVVAPSSIIVKLLKNYGVVNKINIIPTGINYSHFKNGNAENFKTQFNIDKNKKILLNVSRVAFEKNIGLLLEMVAKVKQLIPEVILIIAGEGPAKNTYIEQVKKLQLDKHVIFVGYLDRTSELIDCYHAADIFVFSSLTETQGLVLLEAMASGVPVISVAAMGTHDILEQCEGALITDGTIDDFSNKVVSLLTDQHKYINTKHAAIEYSKMWDSTLMAEKMISFYREIISNTANNYVNK